MLNRYMAVLSFAVITATQQIHVANAQETLFDDPAIKFGLDVLRHTPDTPAPSSVPRQETAQPHETYEQAVAKCDQWAQRVDAACPNIPGRSMSYYAMCQGNFSAVEACYEKAARLIGNGN